MSRSFKIWYSPVYFSLLLPVLLMSHLRNHCQIQCHETFILFSSRRFLCRSLIHFYWCVSKNYLLMYRGIPGGSMIKNPPGVEEMQEIWVWFLGLEYPRRRKWQPTPVFLPEKTPWREEPDGLKSIVGQRVGHDGATEDIVDSQYCLSFRCTT